MGYNRTTVVDQPVRLGVVPVGYADGYRAVSETGMAIYGLKVKRCQSWVMFAWICA